MKQRTITLLVGILLGATLFGGDKTLAAGLFAEPSTQRFYMDGHPIQLEAYSIKGTNYVKLRDIGQIMDFGVTYNAADNSVHISSDGLYIAEATTSIENSAVLNNGKPAAEENALELLHQLEQEWPTGTVWGTHDTPGTYKNEVPSTESTRIMNYCGVSATYGCSGYAAMVSSLLFGDSDNPGRMLEDNSQMRPGDIVFVVSPEGTVGHVVIALESPNDEGRFHYTDGNHDKVITWPDPEHPDMRSYSLNGFSNGYRLEVWTRYPENIPITGGSVEAWPTGINK